MKVIIIGGVAGGASAAARLRRLDENAEITIYEKSGYVSYANCGLPYYIGGIIEDKEELTLQTPESFKNRFNIDVKVLHEVISIDPLNKEVTVKNLSDNTDRWLYLLSFAAPPVNQTAENCGSLLNRVNTRGDINSPCAQACKNFGYFGNIQPH